MADDGYNRRRPQVQEFIQKKNLPAHRDYQTLIEDIELRRLLSEQWEPAPEPSIPPRTTTDEQQYPQSSTAQMASRDRMKILNELLGQQRAFSDEKVARIDNPQPMGLRDYLLDIQSRLRMDALKRAAGQVQPGDRPVYPQLEQWGVTRKSERDSPIRRAMRMVLGTE